MAYFESKYVLLFSLLSSFDEVMMFCAFAHNPCLLVGGSAGMMSVSLIFDERKIPGFSCDRLRGMKMTPISAHPTKLQYRNVLSMTFMMHHCWHNLSQLCHWAFAKRTPQQHHL
jgi:hypothetical protein